MNRSLSKSCSIQFLYRGYRKIRLYQNNRFPYLGPDGPSPISQKLDSSGIKWDASTPSDNQIYLLLPHHLGNKSYIIFQLGIQNYFRWLTVQIHIQWLLL